MPKSPAKRCRQPGCRNKIKGSSYCKDHKGRENTKFRNKNGSTHQWYHTSLWRGNQNKELGDRGGLREQQLMQQPYCAECEKEGSIEQATVADHIKPFRREKTEKEMWELFSNINNLQSLCVHHHRVKTGKGL